MAQFFHVTFCYCLSFTHDTYLEKNIGLDTLTPLNIRKIHLLQYTNFCSDRLKVERKMRHAIASRGGRLRALKFHSRVMENVKHCQTSFKYTSPRQLALRSNFRALTTLFI